MILNEFSKEDFRDLGLNVTEDKDIVYGKYHSFYVFHCFRHIGLIGVRKLYEYSWGSRWTSINFSELDLAKKAIIETIKVVKQQELDSKLKEINDDFN